MLDRAAIFRSAHEHARRELTWGSRNWTYRKAFAISLRAVYAAEQEAAEERAYQAAYPPIPLDVQQRVRELHAAAWGCRITSAGNLEYDRLSAQARDLVDAARCVV